MQMVWISSERNMLDWAGERASSTGSAIIKAQEAEQPEAAAVVAEEHLSSFTQNSTCVISMHTLHCGVCYSAVHQVWHWEETDFFVKTFCLFIK